MAKLFLDANDTSYKVSNSNTEIFGANGDQAIIIDGNLSNIVLDANVERVAFTGSTTDYTYKQVGTDLEVYKNGALVTKIGLQDDTNGTQLTFANGTVEAKFAPSATGLGLTVGGQTVATAAPAAVTIPAANIDVTTFPITAPTFSVASVAATATEGTNAIWTVTLANAPSTTTTVKYTLKNENGATNDDTADEIVTGTAVTATPSVETAPNSGIWEGTLTFAAGATTATISLPVNLDGLTEVGEAMSLTLSNPTGAIVNDASKAATVTFVDAPATTFTLTSTGTGVEVQEGQSITFTVTPNSAVNAATTLILNVKGEALGSVTNTASAADFDSTPAITFAQGETAAKTITLKVASDSTVEGREAYAAEIVDTLNYAARSNKLQGVITDALPTLTLSQNVTEVNEGSNVIFTVTSDIAAPAGGITIPYTLGGNATSGAAFGAGVDYTATPTANIVIAAGEKTGAVVISTNPDAVTEGDETVSITLGNVNNANVSTTAKSLTATIKDTSKALGTTEMTLTGAASVNEGSSATYTVTLGSAPTTNLSIPYTLGGTATSADYTATPTGTISILAGQTTGTLTLAATADSATEGAETVTVTLGAVTGYTAVSGQNAVTTTINDTSVAVTGSSLTFTTAIDVLNGTSGNDTFIGDNTGTNATVTAGDQLNGGAGTDLFKYYVPTGTAIDALVLPQFSSLESLYVNGGTLTTTKTFDATALTGVTAVELESPVTIADTNNFTVKTSATQALTLNKINVAAAGTGTLNLNGTSSITVNGLASSTTDTGTLTLDLTSIGSSLGVVTTGANSKFTLANTGAALETLNVSGDKNATITTALTGLKAVNAANATGAVSLDISGITPNSAFTFTGGSANDSIKFGDDKLVSLTAATQLDGGAGTGDKLGISDTALTTAEYTAINTVRNFEVLGLNAAITVDASKLTTIKEFSLDGNAAQIINNMVTGSKVSVGSHTANVTLSAATGVNDVTLTVNGSATAAVTVGGTVSLSHTNVALVSSGTNATLNTIATLANADNSVITVTGANDLTITNALAGTSIGSKVDAGTFTGKLTVKGSALSDVLIGGSNNDTLDGGNITAAATAVTGVTESAMVKFQPLDAGETFIMGGLTFTAGGAGTSAAQLAAAFATLANGGAGNASAQGTFTGNLTGWTSGAVANTDEVTFTSTTANTDVTNLAATGTYTAGGANTTAAVITTTQGVAAVAQSSQSVDILTGNGGADTFAFSSADIDTTAGVVTAIITDFKTGIDKIKVTNAGSGAGSTTTYVEATTTATSLANLLSAADTALTGGVVYYVGQFGSDSYLVTDGDGNGYTNVIKLTGVTLDQIAATDLIA